jgi:hypothetical protein
MELLDQLHEIKEDFKKFYLSEISDNKQKNNNLIA